MKLIFLFVIVQEKQQIPYRLHAFAVAVSRCMYTTALRPPVAAATVAALFSANCKCIWCISSNPSLPAVPPNSTITHTTPILVDATASAAAITTAAAAAAAAAQVAFVDADVASIVSRMSHCRLKPGKSFRGRETAKSPQDLWGRQLPVGPRSLVMQGCA